MTRERGGERITAKKKGNQETEKDATLKRRRKNGI